MRHLLQITGLLILLFFNTHLSYSQAKQNKYGEEYYEGGYSGSKPMVPDYEEKKTSLVVILKYDNKDLVTGNACVREETVKMGFEYMILCNRKPNVWNRVWIFFYNLGSKTELTFRNGPGWKSRLNKKVEECRRNSGDFVW